MAFHASYCVADGFRAFLSLGTIDGLSCVHDIARHGGFGLLEFLLYMAAKCLFFSSAVCPSGGDDVAPSCLCGVLPRHSSLQQVPIVGYLVFSPMRVVFTCRIES